jgi:hypothetical protein
MAASLTRKLLVPAALHVLAFAAVLLLLSIPAALLLQGLFHFAAVSFIWDAKSRGPRWRPKGIGWHALSAISLTAYLGLAVAAATSVPYGLMYYLLT